MEMIEEFWKKVIDIVLIIKIRKSESFLLSLRFY